jgi:hypothetical protein
VSKRKSLGKDAFEEPMDRSDSAALRKLIRGEPAKGAGKPRELEVKVRLTPSNIKHLDRIRRELERKGKGSYSRSRLIQVAIELLRVEDF